jgi:signal transduction histidine kinase
MVLSWRSPSARLVDVALFVAVTAVLSVVVSADQAGARSPDALAYLWAVGLGALMLIRRTMPRLVLAVTTLGFVAYYVAGYPAIGVAVPISAALFSAAEAGHGRAALATGAAVLVGSTVFRLASGQSASFVLGYELASHAALITAVIALGYSVRTRRNLQRRTEQVVRLVTRQTAMDAAAHAHDQQIALARELHDSIGHSLAVASLFTDVAREASGGSRATALDRVKVAVGDAMTQLRSTVTLLRSAEGKVATQPTLRELHRVLEAPVAAGYDVNATVEDVAASPDVEACVYRMVQEAVTNTMRHSNATRLTIAVRGAAGAVTVSVHDNGSGARPPRNTRGQGLRGMRERAAELGGTLDVDAGSGGWRIHARLPTRLPAEENSDPAAHR